MSHPAPGRAWEVSWVAGVFLLVNLLGAFFQPRLTYQGGKGWEGVGYYAMAEQFARGERPRAEAPMVYRVGTPWLASRVMPLCGNDVFASFRTVNLVANALSAGLLVGWLRLRLRDWRVRAALATLFLVQWDAPARFLYVLPVHTDPWLWVFLLSGLLAVDRARTRPGNGRSIAILSILSFVGVLFREVAAVVPLAFLFVDNPIRRVHCSPGPARWRVLLPPAGRFLPLTAGLAAFGLAHGLAVPEGGYSFGRTALHWAYDKPWLIYLHGWMLAFGQVLFVLIYRWRSAFAWLSRRQGLAVYLLAFAVLGDIGGTDTERLLFWSMPVVYVLLGRVLERDARLFRTVPLALIVMLGQMVSARVFWLTPDQAEIPGRGLYPVLTLFGDGLVFSDLFPFFCPRPVQILWLAQFVMVGAVILVWMRHRERRLAASREPVKPIALAVGESV